MAPDHGSSLVRKRPAVKPTKYVRAYKACISCRTRKAKCTIEDPERPSCQKCLREHRQCVFEDRRDWTKRQRLDTVSTATPGADPQDTPEEEICRPDPQSASGGDQRYTASHQTAFETSFIRGVVANGQDALDILFDAARSQEKENVSNHALQSRGIDSPFSTAIKDRYGTTVTHAETISKAAPETIRVWNICRFVRMGWLSADEAVTFIDLFFKHMAALSPILTDMYSKHENHEALVTNEPFLCCAILMISSRYFRLPGVGSGSRCYFIHQRLWQHCQHLALRVMFGQEKGSRAKTRTIGTIEALLLMCEWHSRAIHFPPEHDGWDSHIHMTDHDESIVPTPQSATARRWLEDVTEPAKRADRMSWMLANLALSLALELNMFSDIPAMNASSSPKPADSIASWRRWRLQRLLYLYNNQLACRLGCVTSIPGHLSRMCTIEPNSRFPDKDRDQSDTLLVSMVALTKFFKSMTDVLFPSVSISKQLIKGERYHGILDHFLPLLDQWKQNHLTNSDLPATSKAVLEIEFHFVRAFANSIGMQAMCERALSEGAVVNSTHALHGAYRVDLGIAIAETEEVNRIYVQNVIDSALAILRLVIKMSEAEALRCAPVRVFLRITTAYVFLFKAISLGVKRLELRSMLDIMGSGIDALHASALDDMHLASHYATILEQHLTKLRESLIASAKPPGQIQPSVLRGLDVGAEQHYADLGERIGDVLPQEFMEFDPELPDMSRPATDADPWPGVSINGDWLFALPFDPSMAPFGSDQQPEVPPALDDATLDFLWNLST